MKNLTKGLVAAAGVAWGIFQIPQVQDQLRLTFAGHPHVLSTLGLLVVVASVLHNPQKQA